MASFAHLHVHTEYSLLDGMSRVKDLVDFAVEQNMDSLAITDHGAMYGVMQFYWACKEKGIKPIIGLEAYLAPRGMADRDPKLDSQYYHLLLIAQNQTGYQNLLKIASASQLEGFYYKPRVDKDFLAHHAEGLICTTGCLAAEIPQMLVEGREKEARHLLGWYMDVFGPDRFYIELQEHDIPDLHKLNQALYQIAPYAEVPFLATNDVHYVRREDANPHDVLLCIGTGNLVSDQHRLRFSDDSYYLRSPEEMIAIFGDVPGAISNTLKVAEMCDVNLDHKEYHLPIFLVPEGYDAQSYLRFLCEDGLIERYGEHTDGDSYRNRLEFELEVIHKMGFDNYFLIVWDLCRFARESDIWYNVRGSGAGSMVAYCLRITNIDPIQNSLLFERFLNPGRVSMPDIDIDYPDDRRAEMIDYCVKRYGEDKVAQIITFGTLGARAAIRDTARALDVPLNEVDQLARLIPAIPGKPVSIEQALEDVPELWAAYEDKSRPYIKSLIDTAKQLEGVSRHASTHAAGVLIADKPLVEYTPLHRPTKGGDGGNGEGLGVVSQWPMEIVESIGLLKVDFLGLRTLTIMRKACELIEQNHKIRYDLTSIPYRHRDGDEEYNRALDQAFELMWRGETSGVFQVEGAGMTRVLTEMKPSRFEHIIAAISLFRPGPLEYIPTYIRRMHGDEDVTYHHPLLEEILSETYGIIVYQEQIMQVASQLFGYSLGDADLMRRAVSKKKEKDLLKHRAIFQKNGPERGVSEDAAGKIFDDIEFFARYGFNKSHAADYAVLTVQTAFLKAHFPHEYMTALLTIERGDTSKVGGYINDCRRMAIPVLPPDINLSGHDFIIQPQPDGALAIRYGLSAIKNVGEGSVEAVISARGKKPFQDVADFCQRVDLRIVGKRALECLIKVGALDTLGSRLKLLASIDRMMAFSTNQHKAAEVGQMSLFGESTGVALQSASSGLLLNDVSEDVPRRELLQWERELVGVYVSEHPLQSIVARLQDVISAYSSDLTEADHDRLVTMAGMVTSVRKHITKSSKTMAFAEIEDLYGPMEVVIWPRTWDETQELWTPDRVLLLRGRVDAAKGEPKLLCEEATNNFELLTPTEHTVTARAWTAISPQEYGDEDAPPPDLNRLFEAAAAGEELESEWEAPYAEAEDEPESLLVASNGNNGHGAPAALSDPAAAAPPTDEIVVQNRPSLAPVESVQTIPEDNGAAAAPIAASRSEGERVRIIVQIARTGDSERDKRRLRRVHGELTSIPGDDPFCIVLTSEEDPIEIDFPHETTHYCADLIERLAAIVGEDAIRIDRL